MRFVTWIWGCGHFPEKWVPTAAGSNIAMPADLPPLEPYRRQLAILSGYDVKLDGGMIVSKFLHAIRGEHIIIIPARR